MAREIVLDTETTGLDAASGHRVIEIACVELHDLLPTGRTFHRYIDPEREIDPDAQRIHGISNAFLAGKPRFADADVANEFLAFVEGASLIAHNASFDRSFIDNELRLAGLACPPGDSWIDTLGLAQKRFPGMYNSLDALCKRFKISLVEREKHGALVDARLLAGVYLELRGGREAGLDLGGTSGRVLEIAASRVVYGPRPRLLPPRLTQDELAAHHAFVHGELKPDAVWSGFEI